MPIQHIQSRHSKEPAKRALTAAPRPNQVHVQYCSEGRPRCRPRHRIHAAHPSSVAAQWYVCKIATMSRIKESLNRRSDDLGVTLTVFSSLSLSRDMPQNAPAGAEVWELLDGPAYSMSSVEATKTWPSISNSKIGVASDVASLTSGAGALRLLVNHAILACSKLFA